MSPQCHADVKTIGWLIEKDASSGQKLDFLVPPCLLPQ